jgi:Zn-dependent peptidase ImmA (M78 family)/transcriptional regulator with XRE-family HTH domain
MSNLLLFPDRADKFIPRRLAEARLAKQWSRAELAREIGVTGQAIGYYETAERRPDMSMLMRLSEALEQPVSFFLKATAPEDGNPVTRYFRSVGPKSQKLNQALDVKTKWLREIVEFIGTHLPLIEVNLPRFDGVQGRSHYELGEIEEFATATRRHFGLGDGPIANMVALLETQGVIVTRFEIGHGNIDAFSSWINRRPYVMLGSDKSSSCRSRYDAAHELGHMLLHREITADDLLEKGTFERIEIEANQFAGAFLFPKSRLLAEFYSTRLSHLEGLKRRWRVSMQAIAHRARDVGVIDDYQYVSFRKQMSHHKSLSVEPLDRDIPMERPAYLLKAWQRLCDEGIVRPQATEDKVGFTLEMVQRLCGLVPEAALPTPPIAPRLVN